MSTVYTILQNIGGTGRHNLFRGQRHLAVPQAGMSSDGIRVPILLSLIPYKSMSQIFIGKCIEDELRRQERSVVWLARKLDCNRTNVYKIFHRSSIDAELLLKISNVLKVNFFQYYIDRFEF